MDGLDDPAAMLCHYTRAHVAFDKILPDKRLLMNPYRRMSDPYENKRPMFRAASAWSEGDSDDEEGNRQTEKFWRLQAAVAHSRDPMCLLSLTGGDPREGSADERPFRCPWARARMWQQYAEDHAGVCLVFDRESLIERLRQELAERGSYWDGPVDYTRAGFGTSDAALVSLNDFRPDALDDDVALHVQRYHREFFFLKTEDWATEFEYRFVWRSAKTGVLPGFGTYVKYRDTLRAVVIGEKFPDWQKPGAKKIAEDAGAELLRMTWDIGRPRPTPMIYPYRGGKKKRVRKKQDP